MQVIIEFISIQELNFDFLEGSGILLRKNINDLVINPNDLGFKKKCN